jgi:hypothetical protein
MRTSLWLCLALAACDRVAGTVGQDLSVGGDHDLMDRPFPSYDLSCVGFTAQSHLVPVSLVVMLDKSGSMGDGINGDPTLKWQPVTAALDAFFNDPASTGVSASLQFFPQSDMCNSDAYYLYSPPSVDMRGLPDLAFGMSMSMVTPSGSTPTLPVVQGAIQYAQDTAAMGSGQRVAIVLVTDGEPDTCNSSINNVALELAKVSAQIPTYVIGVGESLTSLDQLAMAGGTQAATLVAVGDPTTTKMKFLEALDEIRGLVLSCDFAIPPAPSGMTIDYSMVNVTFTPSTTGSPSLLPYDKDCNSNGPGWSYDDANNPTKVVLCPVSCADARGDRNAAINVLFGCGTVGEPVN